MVIHMMADARYEEDTPDLELIVRDYGSSIVKYCYNLLWDYHEAQDAAQEVFLTAAAKIGSLRERQSLTGWLYRVAHNVCMDMLRRRKRAGLFLQREASRNSADVHVDNYDFGISWELRAALNTLSPTDRALVYNRAVDEMEYAELEEIYGMKSAALRKRYERARKKLEAELKKEESDCE